jgi:hypothetical protein
VASGSGNPPDWSQPIIAPVCLQVIAPSNPEGVMHESSVGDDRLCLFCHSECHGLSNVAPDHFGQRTRAHPADVISRAQRRASCPARNHHALSHDGSGRVAAPALACRHAAHQLLAGIRMSPHLNEYLKFLAAGFSRATSADH